MIKQTELFIHKKKETEFLIERKDVATTANGVLSGVQYIYPGEVLTQLEAMNQQFSVAYFDGGYEIIREHNHLRDCSNISLLWNVAFHDYYSNQRVEVQVRANGRKVNLPLSKVWLEWSGRRVSVLQCRGMRPFCIEGRTIDGDSRYFDEEAYGCGDKPVIGARCVGCPHGIRIGRVLECKYFQDDNVGVEQYQHADAL